MAMNTSESFCSNCGSKHSEAAYPKSCRTCGHIVYVNPKVVAVAVIPQGNGVVLVRRAIPPFIGELALPGGYQEMGESLEEAAAREPGEECGVELNPADAVYLGSRTAGGNTLVFFQFPPIPYQTFEPSSEVQEVVVRGPKAKLCFPLHQEMMDRFFQSQGISAT